MVEEALERLGAPKEGSLGEKLRAVQDGLETMDPDLVQKLWRLVILRNQVVHERLPVPDDVLSTGSHTVAQLLVLLERQKVYSWSELSDHLETLRSFPGPVGFQTVIIEPAEAQAPPEVRSRKRPLELPRRNWGGRSLDLPERFFFWKRWRE